MSNDQRLLSSPSFTIFPAIDLRGGRVVRLAQGDPDRQTTYADNPLTWAERWKSEGAAWLHVVNLDGAFEQEASLNLKALEAILTVGLKIEFGGGVRDRSMVEQLLDMGVERVFLGTAAILEPALVDWAISAHGSARIAADIGVCRGKVMVKGWQEATPLTVLKVGKQFKNQGLQWCVLTDVNRDGTGSGVDLASAKKLQLETGMNVVASGGINRLEEVQGARQAGLAGVIIGRALYEGRISLRDCWISN